MCGGGGFSINAITDYNRGVWESVTHPGDLSKTSVSGWGVTNKQGNPLFKELGGSGGTPANAFRDPMGLYGDGGDPVFAKLGIGVEPEVPEVVEQDPLGDEEAAKREASRSSSAKRAQRSRRGASLLGSGAPSLIRQGRGSLG